MLLVQSQTLVIHRTIIFEQFQQFSRLILLTYLPHLVSCHHMPGNISPNREVAGMFLVFIVAAVISFWPNVDITATVRTFGNL